MTRIPRRTIGAVMIGIGVVNVIVSLTAVIVGQHLVRQVETSVDDSLRLTGDALATVDDSIAVIDSLVTTVESGLAVARSTVSAVKVSLEQISGAITDSREFIGTSLPDSLEAVEEVLPTIESIAGSVDRALRLLEEVPFGPSYAPVQPFDEAIANLSRAIDPLPGQLRNLSGDLERVTNSAQAITSQLVEVDREIANLDTRLTQVPRLLDRYADTASRARERATSSRTDLAGSAGSARGLLFALGVMFALSQLVPIWLGSALITNDQTRTPILPPVID